MSDHLSPSDERDPFVARALATLPVPDHAPGFWDRLETSLDEVSQESSPRERVGGLSATEIKSNESDALPPSLIALADIGPAGDARRSRHRRFARMARPLLAAAAFVLVIAAVRISVGGDDTVHQAAAPAETGAVVDTPTTLDSPAIDAHAQVASFLDLLGAGRIDDAAKLLGPRTGAYLVAQSGSANAFLTDAAKDLGAWATSTDRTFTTVVVGPGSMVVIVEGTVMNAGVPEHRVDVFPMTKLESAQTWFVDAWAFDPAIGGRIELGTAAPSNGVRQLHVGQPFEVFADAPGTVRFALAGHDPIDVATVKRGGANVATWTTTAADVGDAAMLTVAFTSDSGTIFTALAAQVQIS